MVFDLDQIVLWGRSFEEYVKMFDLTENDLLKSIVGCGDGPANFNSVMKKRGCKVVSCDPIYKHSIEEIKSKIDKSYNAIMHQLERNKNDFVWKEFKSPEDVGSVRMKSMQEFLNDFENGKKEERYLSESLPELSFNDNRFDLVVSSHFLFLYSSKLSFDFHREAVMEMLRVAKEVRIFPILDLGGKKSPYIEPLITELKYTAKRITIKKVDYEFQRGGNQMLVICK